MNGLIERYKSFLDEGKTERECVRRTIALAEANGYRRLESVDSLKCGDKVYVEDYEKAIALFHIGSEPMEKGMNILGAHIDSPRLDIKMNPLYESEGLVYLDTHYYGGIKKYQWVAMPLAIHGVVVKTTGEKINVVLGEEDDEFTFTISDILPHIAQEQMKKSAGEFIPGEDLDLVVGLGEKDKEGKSKAKEAILSIFKEKYGIEEKDFLSAELEVVPAGKAKYLGLDSSMVLGYGQDDRICAFTSLEALLEGKTEKRTSVCILVDKEEIGSTGATGMDSRFFENATAEVLAAMGLTSSLSLRRTLKNSMMLSSDVNSAYDPLNTSLYDKKNSSYLSGGVVFNKYTGSRGKSGASDANPEFIGKIRGVMDKNGVKYQMAELAKVDVGGGGTIAKFSAYYGMSVIDCGVSILSMHAPWEISSVKDIGEAKNAYKAFLTLE
ncbi:MAG: aminopeptidase [Candidatus Ornithospirochaeta sp.]|nr:aminopeptidase [Sphaerochaetaceae bacterium]MDY5523096.1 aminopeptidase [Candidatus Ornithospirochaeta sp.]